MKGASTSITYSSRLIASSVGTSEYNWLSEDVWESSQLEYVATLSKARPDLGVFAPPPFRKETRFPGSPRSLSRWVLKEASGECKAYAEAIAKPGTFFEVYLSILGGGGDIPDDSIALLISSLMVQLTVDRMLVITLSPLPEVFACSGNLHTVWTPWRGLAGLRSSLPLKEIQLLELTPESWWGSPLGSSTKLSLHYLEKRLERTALEEDFGRKKRRPGPTSLISRFFRW